MVWFSSSHLLAWKDLMWLSKIMLPAFSGQRGMDVNPHCDLESLLPQAHSKHLGSNACLCFGGVRVIK